MNEAEFAKLEEKAKVWTAPPRVKPVYAFEEKIITVLATRGASTRAIKAWFAENDRSVSETLIKAIVKQVRALPPGEGGVVPGKANPSTPKTSASPLITKRQ